jgi:hypothetical protein
MYSYNLLFLIFLNVYFLCLFNYVKKILMGYNIEISFNMTKHSNVSELKKILQIMLLIITVTIIIIYTNMTKTVKYLVTTALL